MTVEAGDDPYFTHATGRVELPQGDAWILTGKDFRELVLRAHAKQLQYDRLTLATERRRN